MQTTLTQKESCFLINKQTQQKIQRLLQSTKIKWAVRMCPKGNLVKMICVSEECQSGCFSCGEEDCLNCHERHEQCETVRISAFQNRINRVIQYESSFFKKLYDIDQASIKQIENSEHLILKQIEEGNLDENAKEILKKMIGDQISPDICGKDAKMLLKELKRKENMRNEAEDILQQVYAELSSLLTRKTIKIKQEVFANFIKGTKYPADKTYKEPFIDSPLLQGHLNQLFINTPSAVQNQLYLSYQYLAIPDEQKRQFDHQYYVYLSAQLKNPNKSKLIYRASKHGFSMEKFHELCDGRAHTLTIVRTQFGKTIIAYASPAWNSSGKSIVDSQNTSCIIILNNKGKGIKFTCTNVNYAIYGHPQCGPCFGQCDIRVQGHTLLTKFPMFYNNNLGKPSQMTCAMLTGNFESSQCKISDYEVHQLFFSKEQFVRELMIYQK